MYPYYEKLLESLLKKDSPQPGSKKEGANKYYLCFEGTDVIYNHAGTDKGFKKDDQYYLRGNTISYTGRLASFILEEEGRALIEEPIKEVSNKHAHAYQSDSVDILNGADGKGLQVGDRLAKGVLLALAAIARGKNDMVVDGFSRGGVCAIVLSRELKRIKQELIEDQTKPPADQKTLAEIIANSNSVPSTGATTGTYSSTKESLELLMKKSPKNLAEKETEVKAKLLDRLNLLQMKVFPIDPVPGGNLFKLARYGWYEKENFFDELPEFVTHQCSAIQQDETSNCFQPVIYRKAKNVVLPGPHGTACGSSRGDNGEHLPEGADPSSVQDIALCLYLNMEYPEPKDLKLDDLNEVIPCPELNALTFNFLISNKQQRNQIFCKLYQKVIDNKETFQFLAATNYGTFKHKAVRQVYLHQSTFTPISDLNPHAGGEHFVNQHHVEVFLSAHVEGFQKKETLPEQVKWLADNIRYALIPSENNKSNDIFARLKADPATTKLVPELVSNLVNTIAQTYMRETLADKERIACRKCVKSTFALLKSVVESSETGSSDSEAGSSKPDPTSYFATELKATIKKDLTQTLLEYQNQHLSIAQALLSGVGSSVTPDKSEADKEAWIIYLQGAWETLGTLNDKITALKPFCDNTLLIQSWSKTFPNLQGDADVANVDILTDRLQRHIEEQRILLETAASKLLMTMPKALRTKPVDIKPDFYGAIRRFSPQAHEALDRERAAAVDRVQELEDKLSQSSQQITELHAINVRSEMKNEQLTDIMDELTPQIDNLHSNLEAMSKVLESDKLNTAGLNRQIEELRTACKKSGTKNRELENRADELMEQATELQDELRENVVINTRILEERDAMEAGRDTSQDKLKGDVETLRTACKKSGVKNRALESRYQKLMRDAEVLQGKLREHDVRNTSILEERDAMEAGRDTLQEQLNLSNEKLDAIKLLEETKAEAKIKQLLPLCKSYLENLNKSSSNAPLLQKKKSLVQLLHNTLYAQVPATERLASFTAELNKKQLALHKHRHPVYLRFIRECLRVLSGVWLYQTISGQNPSFFKPSEGDVFTEKVQKVTSMDIAYVDGDNKVICALPTSV